jgi:hypothetical protein
MKIKLFNSIAIVLLLMLLSITTFIQAQNVSIEEVRIVANNFAAKRLNNSFIPQTPDISTFEYNGITTYYICNLFPEGFVMVSADKNIIPVLAYSAESQYFAENDNFALNQLLKNFSEQIYQNLVYEKHYSAKNQLLWSNFLNGSINSPKGQVSPLINTKWNQTIYYNEFCPPDPLGPDGKCVTGCVATALGQLANYFRWPLTGNGFYTSQDTVYGTLSVDYGSENYNFNEMAISLTRSNPASSKMVYNIGVGVDMHYGPNGSGMNNHKAAHVMKSFFKYSDSTHYIFRDSVSLDWDSLIISNLEQGIPMYYAGWSDTNYIMGHAFIVDGYQDSCYFHFNWGWGGSSDGYFYTDNLTPSGSNFTLMHELVIGMYPEGQYPYYCNGTDTLTSSDGTIDDGSGPLFGYRNNTDCSWLIAPQDSVTAIKLSFIKFDTEAGNDILTIYRGSNSSSPVIGTYSGNQLPSDITVPGNRAYLKFTSNGSDTACGFLVSYSIVTPLVFCSSLTTYTAESDTIEDGSGPYLYHGNSFCRWKIAPSSGSPVILTFTEFDLDSSDYVKVVENPTNDLLGEFKGNQLPPVLYSSNGKMTITFKTSATTHGQGFKCHYRTSPVSVAEIDKNSLVIYPNPAGDFICVKGIDSECEISIYDIHGRKVYKKSHGANDNTTVISIENLSKGMYILSVFADNYNYTEKFFKE